jgi:hypothetical protein
MDMIKDLLKRLVKTRRLTPIEKISQRLGYMGTAFIMISPYLLKYDNMGAVTYVIGGILSLPQVFVAKQWNIVAVNMNVILGYAIYLITQ